MFYWIGPRWAQVFEYEIIYSFSFQSDRLHEEEIEGIREKMAVEMAKLEEDLSILKSNIQRQDDIIEQKLRVVSQQLH
jgi:hypothetical protein